MSGIPEKINANQNVPYSTGAKFARIDNNPNVRNAQYYTPIIPAYQHTYRPEFGKSPLTSVQMYRKNKTRSINFNQHPYQTAQPQEQYKKSFLSDIDWKKYLLWGLAALLAIGLLIGLIFLIKALARGDDRNRYQDESSSTGYYTGVNPIYVSPVPYSTMQVPTTSGYAAEPNYQDRYIYATAPAIPPYYTPESPIKKQQQPKQQPQSINPVTQPSIRYASDSNQNYVNPVDVYEHHHK